MIYLANNGATYPAEPIWYGNLTKAIREGREIIYGNHIASEGNRSLLTIADADGIIMYAAELVGHGKHFRQLKEH